MFYTLLKMNLRLFGKHKKAFHIWLLGFNYTCSMNATLSLDQVLALPLERREFIQGELFVPPAPEPAHQDLALHFAFLLKIYLQQHPQGRVFIAPLDVFIDNQPTQPDVIFVASHQLDLIEEKRISGAPVWLIEVVSPTSHKRDFSLKKKLYLEHGVQEYWVISLEGRVIWVFTSEDTEGKVHGTGNLSPAVLPEFSLEVPGFFRAVELL
jgi:Uma2 family endonuclease